MAKTLVYQMYPISFKNIGAMTRHLLIPSQLGADYVWLSPLYLSPRDDHGYDVANYKAIDPRFGTMDDFEYFIEIAHSYGLGVIMDLVLNHTSTKHAWFTTHPQYYCWAKEDKPDWKNLFNGGPAWKYHDKAGKYYLHTFHETQADLNWFPDGSLNRTLVKEFRKIVDFWTDLGVDGWRLDVPQSINKDFASDHMEFKDLLFGYKAAEVINAVFKGKNTFLMMECFDPSYGGLTEYYAENTPVDFVLNVMVKDAISEGEDYFQKVIKSSAKNSHFMLDFESHDSPRFPSRSGFAPEKSLRILFESGAEGICLYQGQELGLYNPNPRELTDKQMLDLDAQTLMKFRQGENLDDLRPNSRANARISLDISNYINVVTESEIFKITRNWVEHWKQEVHHEV